MERNNLPDKIKVLLDKKGWTWPPDEKLKAKMEEAAQRLVGSIEVDEETARELFRDRRRFEHLVK